MPESISNLTGFTTHGLDQLLRWAAAHQVSFGFERSARCQPGLFETRRALYSFARDDFGPKALDHVLQQAQTMHAPDQMLQNLARFFSACAYVHFGFEYSGDVRIGKCYLELPAPSADTPPISGRLQFLGFKWSMNDSSVAVVTRYRSLVASSRQAVERLMLKNADQTFCPVLVSLLDLLSPATSTDLPSCRLLEIEEEGSDRNSYDLNVYDLQRPVHDLTDHLPQMAAAFELPLAALQTWAARFAPAPIGHIATGVGRNGHRFLTLYHGERHSTATSPTG